MTTTTPFPPHHPHSTHPITPSHALSLLTAYLTATTTDASLHPNALLSESGPISATTGANTGLVLHNLRRVEAGLRGENLGVDLSFGKVGGLPLLEGWQGELEGGGGGEEWQDRGEFERSQEVTVGEVGERGVGSGVGVGIEGVEVPRVEETKSSGDKLERKKRKKERRKLDRAKILMKAQREREAEM
ncbi:hypothetical protein MMC12_006641 [Toensbergia leucococca]|nr:hypothetical protein [Toensbergia leucococca]